jgi:hypothetical protein
MFVSSVNEKRLPGRPLPERIAKITPFSETFSKI